MILLFMILIWGLFNYIWRLCEGAVRSEVDIMIVSLWVRSFCSARSFKGIVNSLPSRREDCSDNFRHTSYSERKSHHLDIQFSPNSCVVPANSHHRTMGWGQRHELPQTHGPEDVQNRRETSRKDCCRNASAIRLINLYTAVIQTHT